MRSERERPGETFCEGEEVAGSWQPQSQMG